MDGLPQERIRAALEELLGWPPMSRSPQLARFLSYIVEAKLRGDEASIKAYAIAVDVFGRAQTFDPQSDPIVRVQARRLRALLEQYYAEGRGAGVRIHLPVGRYVPEFADAAVPIERRELAESVARAMAELPTPANQNASEIPTGFASKSVPRARNSVLGLAAMGAAAIIVVGIAATAVFTLPRDVAPPPTLPEFPVVAIGEFANLTGGSDLDSFSAQLGEGLRTTLAKFEDISLVPADEAGGDNVYRLSGVLHPAAPGTELVASLRLADDEIWTGTYAELPAGAGASAAVAATTYAIARELAPFRGPLHAAGRAWLDAQARPLAAVNGYVCLLSYRLARETGNSNHIADALACEEKLLLQQPDLAIALSATAWLETRAIVNRGLRVEDIVTQLAAPLAQAERAVALAPESSLVREHLASTQNWRLELGLAQQGFVEALRLNPLNTDARASYAITLSRASNWELGAEQAALAIRDTPFPSAWYFYPAALNAYRQDRLSEAIEFGQRAAGFSGGEVGSVIAFAAAAEVGRTDVTEPLLPRIMGMESLRRAGIITWLGGQILERAVLDRIGAALVRGGIPADALTAPF